MRRTVTGKRLYSREFKIAAVRRVLGGEPIGKVARDLDISRPVLWRWKKRVIEYGEEHLNEIGAPPGKTREPRKDKNQELRIAELERVIGRQQMEIRFLDKALRRVEELRQKKNDDGAAASSK